MELKCPVELVPGKSGVFEVSADGKSLFSKKQSVRFPKEGEIVTALKNLRVGAV
jgi:selT/selW/selH-like putative selenoprotein